MLLHDFRDFPKLRAIGAHKDKMVFHVLLFCRPVVFGACNGKQGALGQTEMMRCCEPLVWPGAQAQQPSAGLQDRQLPLEFTGSQRVNDIVHPG